MYPSSPTFWYSQRYPIMVFSKAHLQTASHISNRHLLNDLFPIPNAPSNLPVSKPQMHLQNCLFPILNVSAKLLSNPERFYETTPFKHQSTSIKVPISNQKYIFQFTFIFSTVNAPAYPLVSKHKTHPRKYFFQNLRSTKLSLSEPTKIF